MLSLTFVQDAAYSQSEWLLTGPYEQLKETHSPC